jgi:hypothetical protein
VDKTLLFDLLIFNQPYYPAVEEVIFGLGNDGGKDIIHRFLSKAKSRSMPDARIIMPYSDMAGEANNPEPIAKSLGYGVTSVFERKDMRGLHRILEMRL